MYLLKYKMQGEKDFTKKYFKSVQAVAEHMKFLCGADNLAECLKVAKEYNIRFYLTYKKEN